MTVSDDELPDFKPEVKPKLDPDKTRAALDEAIRDHVHACDNIDDGEVVVSWVTLVATRGADGGGAVQQYPGNAAMPYWELRGMLHEMISRLEVLQYADDVDDEDED